MEVTVLSVKREGAPESFEGASVFTFPPSFPARFGNSNQAVRWLWENARGFDLVLVSEIWSVLIQRAMYVLRKLGVPFVVQPRGSLDPSDLKKKRFLKQVLGRLIVRGNLQAAQCLLAASEAEQERLQTFGAVVKRHTLPHPVNPNPAGDRRRMREELGIASDQLVFLYLSRIDPKKRVHLLLDAFELAAPRLPDWRLLIAGDGHPTLVAELRARAQSLSCARRISFLGFQGGQQKSDLLAAADVFVLPSEFENFGIAVVEALHAGLPVIVATGVQLWQGIIAAGAGLSFTDSPRDLAELLLRIGNDPSLRAGIARAAAGYASRFTPKELTPIYSAFWRTHAKAPSIDGAAT